MQYTDQRQTLAGNIEGVDIHYHTLDISTEQLEEYTSVLPPLDMAGFPAEKKKRFVLGRLCAQTNLAETYAIDRSEFGFPLFPDSLVGSISHSKDFAIAAVASRENFTALGIDIERLITPSRLSVIIKKIFTKEEFEYLQTFSPERTLEVATVAFSAKESLYKLINPLVHSSIKFSEGRVLKIDLASGRYTIELVGSNPLLADYLGEYPGHIYRVEDNVVTICTMRQSRGLHPQTHKSTL